MGWTRTDDIDGAPGAEQVVFGYEGKTYTIDLAEKNYADFHAALAPFVAVASVLGEHLYDPEATAFEAPGANSRALLDEELTRIEADMEKIAGPRPQRRQKTRSARKAETKTSPILVRQWARENGLSVTERGRIPAAIQEQYEAAHAGE